MADDDARHLDLLFHSVLSRFYTIRAKQPAAGGVTLAQMRVLWTLEREGSALLGEIARMLCVSNSTATELSDRLVRGGYAKRRAEPADRRRRVALHLTPKGRALLAQFARLRTQRWEYVLRKLSSGEVRRLAGSLAVVARLLEKSRDE
jgi:DNA-binding MarR family transcriptional regulator